MIIGVLISIVIAIVVGVTMIPVVMSTLEGESNSSEILNSTPTAVNAVVGALPYIFVVVLIIGAVAWIGGSDGKLKVPTERVGRWIQDRWNGRTVTKPEEFLLEMVKLDEIELGLKSGGATREIPVIEVEVTPRKKLGKDEVGWG